MLNDGRIYFLFFSIFLSASYIITMVICQRGVKQVNVQWLTTRDSVYIPSSYSVANTGSACNCWSVAVFLNILSIYFPLTLYVLSTRLLAGGSPKSCNSTFESALLSNKFYSIEQLISISIPFSTSIANR
jgi:hypothetical protein